MLVDAVLWAEEAIATATAMRELHSCDHLVIVEAVHALTRQVVSLNIFEEAELEAWNCIAPLGSGGPLPARQSANLVNLAAAHCNELPAASPQNLRRKSQSQMCQPRGQKSSSGLHVPEPQAINPSAVALRISDTLNMNIGDGGQ
ncbi:hypothetical protein E4U13_005047 [Claviceps humidiphila]|uniref:Uncharacterized protein n=1 Tax=Claviceps humidiphila TaxID=1294629 RepID=A0A9P7Q7K3_9HYPO|nr:hypothetical protein E4U13_005047 [Claviceps humidiphila]